MYWIRGKIKPLFPDRVSRHAAQNALILEGKGLAVLKRKSAGKGFSIYHVESGALIASSRELPFFYQDRGMRQIDARRVAVEMSARANWNKSLDEIEQNRKRYARVLELAIKNVFS